EPDTRGTFRLVVGCLTTLSLCVYTALHLNIPPRPDRVARPSSFSSAMSKKLVWVLLGMFAPELVVYTAWSQWIAARRLTRAIQATNPEWTMTHSFFAVMGGFAVDTRNGGEREYMDGSPRLHLTANGIALLAELGALPAVSAELIRDKSKANRVTKLLVVIQTVWLVVECVARAASRLPLTLLELNTIAHVACAFVAYVLWWNKPLDVEQPVVLACGKGRRPLVAAMCMFSRRNPPDGHDTLRPEIHDILHFVPHQAGEKVMDLAGTLRIARYRNTPGRFVTTPSSLPGPEPMTVVIDDDIGAFRVATERGDDTQGPPKTAITLYSGDVLLPLGFAPNIASTISEDLRQTRYPSHSTSLPRWEADATYDLDHQATLRPAVRMHVDMTTVTRWTLACESLREHEAAWSNYRTVVSQAAVCDDEWYAVYKYRTELPGQADFVAATVPNWPGRHLMPSRHGAFFALCVLLYGGVHATAWNEYFPSEIEACLWHVSSIYVAASGLLWLALKATQIGLAWFRESYLSKKQRASPLSWLNYFVTPLGTVLVLIPMYVIAATSCLYVCARIYLVVEAFISLRDVSPDVYLTPEWTRYLVHF
ncbi:hypothetical protein QBC47DRAFT_311459, partial [Echria macrotheca]